MHSFVHIHILHINMAVDMNDADVTLYMRCDSPHVWVTQAMITTTNNRERARTEDMGNGLANLIKGFFDIAGYHKNISSITQFKFFG